MSLEVQKLRKEYGSQVAVNDLSFNISDGQIVGFLGPNGAGKSTTMKMIACHVAPTSGTANVCGYDIINHPLEVKKQIGYLPEQNPLYYDMYVLEYLKFVAGVHQIKDKKNAIDRVIDKVGLQKEVHKKIGQLSKGYKQRVGIAQAIIHQPKVLILDEPTSGLDTNQLSDIRNLIIELGKENIVILSTHIMQEVEAMCDRVLIINDGNLIADNDIATLKQKSKGEKQIEVVFEEQIDMNLLQTIEGINSLSNQGNTYTIGVEQDRDIRKDIFQWAVANNHILLEMTQKEERVEDIFKQMTR